MSNLACRKFKFLILSLSVITFDFISFAALAIESDIELATAQYQEVDQERVLDALVEAVHKATVSAQTSGRVSKIYFDVNDYAKKGDILLRMRDADQQAGLKVAQANFNQTKTEFKRISDLFAKKLISKSLVDKAQAALKSTSARLDQAQENLERTVVRAPYSGIMVKRHIEVGETARTGTALFTGLSLESLRVAVNLPQDIINRVMQHKTARLILPGEDKSISSTSMTISPYADETSHTFLVRVNLPSGDLGLYPGMAVKVAFAIGKIRKLVVPVSAVTHRSEVTAVYVMNEKKQISMRQVRVGQKINDEMIEVLSGLEENEQVATDPVKSVSYLKEQQVN
ncbi:MAG: efflux RND transporter periplasmic adaptor subunit [Gammaproteobacteria bacterium]|nr:MAG: efflux RND transporter periplasmic adaptor subunit [Gammaproteobacteria bacterium]